jgi:CcdB protein
MSIAAPAVPLQLRENAPLPARRLNPVFEIKHRGYAAAAWFANAVIQRECGPVVASLANEQAAVMDVVNIVIGGY